jgi:hypothetical protein
VGVAMAVRFGSAEKKKGKGKEGGVRQRGHHAAPFGREAWPRQSGGIPIASRPTAARMGGTLCSSKGGGGASGHWHGGGGQPAVGERGPWADPGKETE